MKKQKQLTNKDLPAISQKDFVEIIEQAPEVIQTASSELKKRFCRFGNGGKGTV